MRKLMWFTIGLGIVCALFAYILPLRLMWAVAAVAAAGLAGSWLFSRRWKWLGRITLLCGGAMIGLWLFFGFQVFRVDPLIPVDGTQQQLTLTAADYGRPTDSGTRVDATASIGGQTVKIRAFVQNEIQIQPGDRLSGNFRLRLTFPDGTDGSSYHAAASVFFLAYQSGELGHIPTEARQFRYLPIHLRESIKGILGRAFSQDVYPFVVALLLGDTSQIDYELDTAFRISGIAHLVAVSGMHVAVLYGVIQMLAMRRRFLTALLTIPALLLFTAIAGFTPSITRASLMIGLMVLGQALNHEYDAPTALSFSCLVMLVANPFVITSVSFQLSVACVVGILIFSSPIQAWIEDKLPKFKPKSIPGRFVKSITVSVGVSLSSTVMVTPLCALYFGTVSTIGILTNLCTLWAANLLFYGIILTIPLYLIWAGLGQALGWILAWLARFVTGTAVLFSRLPLAAVYVESPFIMAWLFLLYMLLVVLLLQKHKKPLALGCWACLALCVALVLSWTVPRLSGTRLTVLDVGQGQAILIQNGGRTMLVDCGGDNDEDTADLVANTLLSQGIRRLDAVVVTHCDRDHAGGIPYLLTRIPTDHLLYPATETIPVCPGGNNPLAVSQDQMLTLGDCKVTVFAPPLLPDDNDNSLCVLVEGADLKILITGDRSDFGEFLLLQFHSLPDVDVLIAGHHGSGRSTSQALLDAVRPETVVISVSEDNGYDHPSQELLKRLELAGCSVLRTDRDGTVVLFGKQKALS